MGSVAIVPNQFLTWHNLEGREGEKDCVLFILTVCQSNLWLPKDFVLLKTRCFEYGLSVAPSTVVTSNPRMKSAQCDAEMFAIIIVKVRKPRLR